MLELLLHETLNLHGIDAKFLEHKVRHVAPFLQDTLQEVHRLNGLLVSHLRCVHSLLDGFLSFDCKFVECHILFSFLFLVLMFTPLHHQSIDQTSSCDILTELLTEWRCAVASLYRSVLLSKPLHSNGPSSLSPVLLIARPRYRPSSSFSLNTCSP